MNSLINIYNNVKFESTKWSTYFDVYEELLSPYKDKDICLVEVGISKGGSLFMWREFLGKKSRIIGIDISDHCKLFEKEGFEIFIGDQSSKKFWENFYEKVGAIDILIDDGGHKNIHTIPTTHYSIENINDNGLIITEDLYNSYSNSKYRTKYSYLNYLSRLHDDINSRSTHCNTHFKNSFKDIVYSVSLYESMSVIHVNRKLCLINTKTSNSNEKNIQRFEKLQKSRVSNDNWEKKIVKKFPFVRNIWHLLLMIRYRLKYNIFTSNYLYETLSQMKLKKYFK